MKDEETGAENLADFPQYHTARRVQTQDFTPYCALNLCTRDGWSSKAYFSIDYEALTAFSARARD